MLMTGFALLAGALAAPAVAAPLEGRAALVERYAPAADISGAPLVGLVAGRSGAVLPQTVTARIPGAWAGETLCVRLVSSDGRYSAFRPFDVPADWQTELAQLAIPTQFESQLNQLQPEELGILVSLDDCSGGAAGERIVPATWSGDGLAPGAVLLVNSFRADEAYLFDAASGSDVSCAPLAVATRTAFDTACPLPEAWTGGSGVLELELNRVRRGSMMGSDYFAIDLR